MAMSDSPPIVAIVWEDALVRDSHPWTENADHTYKPHLVHQVGFLLSHTQEGIILTQAWHPESVAARDQIPLAMVRSMTVLQPAPEPKPKRRR
jgi:hypothetical protein